MDNLSSILDLLSIVVVVIVLSAIIWAMLRYYEIIEQAKLYIPSTINIWEKVLTKAIWADKNGLVSGRLACTSSKTRILDKIGI